MYWTCVQCHLLCMWEICSNIVIGLSILYMWSVFCVFYKWVLGSNIAIGLYIQGKWSVFCVS